MMELRKLSPPDWLTNIFKEIDNKSFGSSFDILSPTSTFEFGTGNWKGRESIIANLRKFDQGMDTEHKVLEYWDAGEMKFFTGTVGMTFYDGRESVRPVMSHVMYMENGQSNIVKHWKGAVGPTDL